MEKTTVYLPKELKKRLRNAARKRGVSEAELIRQGISAVLPPLPRFPLFDSGDPTFARRADDILAEGFGLEGMPSEMQRRWRKSKPSEPSTDRR